MRLTSVCYNISGVIIKIESINLYDEGGVSPNSEIPNLVIRENTIASWKNLILAI